jgi:hypothetical protein
MRCRSGKARWSTRKIKNQHRVHTIILQRQPLAHRAAVAPTRRSPAGCGQQSLAGRRTARPWIPRRRESALHASPTPHHRLAFAVLDPVPEPRAGQVLVHQFHLGLLAFASQPRCRLRTNSTPRCPPGAGAHRRSRLDGSLRETAKQRPHRANAIVLITTEKSVCLSRAVNIPQSICLPLGPRRSAVRLSRKDLSCMLRGAARGSPCRSMLKKPRFEP